MDRSVFSQPTVYITRGLYLEISDYDVEARRQVFSLLSHLSLSDTAIRDLWTLHPTGFLSQDAKNIPRYPDRDRNENVSVAR